MVTGEFEDPALLNAFGELRPGGVSGADGDRTRGAAAATAWRSSGGPSAVRERYYAISVERRLKHPGVVAITSVARTKIFA